MVTTCSSDQERMQVAGSQERAPPATVVETDSDHSAKKQRLELLPSGPVKQEMVGAAEQEVPRMEVGLEMDITLLHCPLCLRPFKPPVFQCKRGHLACGGCLAVGVGCGQCDPGGAAFDIPNTAMDAIVSAARVECPHDGCETCVTYHEVQEHQSACPHAPCHCSEAGCGFAGPALALAAHLACAHAMPVHKVPYGKVHRIQFTVPARRLLVGDEDEGGAFLLTVGALGTATVVSVVRIRAEACPWPQYTVKMWANGPPVAANRRTDTVLADFEATSSTLPGAVSFEDLTSFLVVPPRYLVGDGQSRELSLHLRIERTTS